MRHTLFALTFVSGLLSSATFAQSRPPARSDSVIRSIWVEGQEKSQLYPLAQALLDSIGPRLTGSPEQKQAIDWATAVYRRWGVPVRAEQYGAWKAWQRGTLQVDLIAPRVHSLEGKMFTWSVGTDGPLQGAAIVSPIVANAAEFEKWLPQVQGKFLLFGPPEPSCRPDAN